MSDVAAVVLAGVDPERVEVREREILGPQLRVRCDGGWLLSIIGEIDAAGLATDYGRRLREPQAPLPLAAGEVEIGLLHQGGGLAAEPLRHVPFEEAAAICRLALAGDVEAFRPFYEEEGR